MKCCLLPFFPFSIRERDLVAPSSAEPEKGGGWEENGCLGILLSPFFLPHSYPRIYLSPKKAIKLAKEGGERDDNDTEKGKGSFLPSTLFLRDSCHAQHTTVSFPDLLISPLAVPRIIKSKPKKTEKKPKRA